MIISILSSSSSCFIFRFCSVEPSNQLERVVSGSTFVDEFVVVLVAVEFVSGPTAMDTKPLFSVFSVEVFTGVFAESTVFCVCTAFTPLIFVLTLTERVDFLTEPIQLGQSSRLHRL